MANLFLDGIWESGNYQNSACPNAIRLTIPSENVQTLQLIGLMAGDASFSLQNKWAPVISDVNNLRDLTSLMGSSSMFTWINASTMCWNGTAPISLGVEFYLINYKSGLNLEDGLKALMKLATLYQDGAVTAKVHGGYAADVLDNNNSAFFSSEFKKVKGSELSKVMSGLYDESGYAKGAVTVTFGHTLSIRNLLVSRVNVQKSMIEVAGQNGDNIKPLYYKVEVQFTGVRPMLTTDVDSMF